MRIQTKVIALIGGLFLGLSATQYFIQQQILLPGFEELERQSAETDMQRVDFTLNRELDLLQSMSDDWGNWDGVYRFMKDRKLAFIEENITTSAIAGLRLNAVAFVDLSGRFAWSDAVKLGTDTPLDIDLIAKGELPTTSIWRDALRSGKSFRGLIATNQGPMMVSLGPILNGDAEGPHRGMMLFGRLLTGAEIDRIAKQAQVDLAVAATRRSLELPKDMLPAGTLRSGAQAILVGKDTTQVYRVFSDIEGDSLLTLRIAVQRDISARGRQFVNSAVLFLIGAGACALMLLILLLNRLVLGPLARVTEHAIAVGKSDDLTARLNSDRKDELGVLAMEFDRMVAQVQAARRQLVDQSFDAGIADYASGILHNLGNAITPLGVKIVGLRDALQASSAADINLVATELLRDMSDTSRNTELLTFLKLTGDQLGTQIDTAKSELESLAENVQAIQQVLSEQHAHSRSAKVTEMVQLAGLVEQSLELVPIELRDAMQLHLDDSLKELASIRLARTTVQQIFQNLIVNAAESIREAGRKPGSLRISAQLLDTVAGAQLQIRFADDGLGIPAEDLQRIFQKGFSTKPRSTNSGIGLHWSANAANSLGGSIRAESAGRNAGATLIVTLLVQRATVPLQDVA